MSVRRHRLGMLAVLGCGVALAHGCTVRWAAARLVDLDEAAALPPRPALVSVRTLEPEAPAPAPAPARADMRPAVPMRPRAPSPDRRALAAGSDTVASAPDASPSAPRRDPADATDATDATGATTRPDATSDAASAPTAAGAEVAAASAPTVEAATGAASRAASAATATADAAPASGPASAPAFVWPESTLVRYRLTGNHQGDIHGQAEVEWIKQGAAYEMHMDIVIGLPFAPLLDRHLRSAGRITADGLVPERFDEDSKRAFQDRWRLTMGFDERGIQVGGVRRFDQVRGVQDTLSQFGQLSFRFGLDPALLTPGGVVALPLALPRHVDVWSYHVLPPETLQTPFGPLDAAHLVPTKPAGNGDLSAEIWFAPTLRYLPVRIRIAQDAATWIDLLIDRKPQLEAPTR